MKSLSDARFIPPLPNHIIVPQITSMAATGFTKIGIARAFHVSVKTFNRWLEEDEELAEAFKIGRDQERETLHNMLFKKATEKGDSVAAMFLLKARHGYKEGDQSEQSNRVAVVFHLPGAMTPDQYRTIEAVAHPKPKGNPHAD